MANKQKIDLAKFIPGELKNELNTSFAANLYNRFLSEEQSVFISGQIGKITDPSAAVIQASDLDREQNALVPAMYFKTGTVESVFTFDDILNKMQALGVDVNNLKSILAEQNLNLAPPIDLDKFINFSSYYWTANSELPTPLMPWNPSMDPEYYVIAKPERTSTVKLPVKVATTRDIKLYGKDRAPEKVTILFSSATDFTVTGDQGYLYISTGAPIPNVAPAAPIPNLGTLTGPSTSFTIFAPDLSDSHSGGHGIGVNVGFADPLFTFNIAKGQVDFEAGDSFQINITYFTGSNTISFTPVLNGSSLDKGFISNIVPRQSLMAIDSVIIHVGDTVLVKNQNNPAENGIYVVRADKWLRAPNFTDATDFTLNSRFYINTGVQGGQSFDVSVTPAVLGTDALSFTSVGTVERQTNDWQVYNYWMHKDDVAARGFTDVVQATRPIIEYDNQVKLNAAVDADGNPADVGTTITQTKISFNQLPQFDLYYYDGTHAKITSGIFFYEEDPDFDVDAQLQRRVKLTVNSDYVYGLGIKDVAGRLLFFKKNDVLKTVWEPGVTSPQASTIQFSGEAADTKGSLIVTGITLTADVQNWTVTALTSTSFKVVGSRSGSVGTFNIPGSFDYPDELSISITAGVTPFSVGDSFSFSIRNKVAPRYVKKDADGNIVNVEGGPLGDVNQEGTWLTPRRMFENMPRTLSTEIAYGDFIDHFRSVIKSQDGFEGSSFGINNFRNIDHDLGFGGNIREYSSNFPLLASMLIQQNLSPISIIDFAEKQYALGLASIDQFLVSELASYIATTAVPLNSAIDPNDPAIQTLFDEFQTQRATNQTLREVFGDTTAAVVNWPITLPMMGMTPAVVPRVDFDLELGIDVLVHHDGHLSPLISSSVDFDRTLTSTPVTRSDGTTTTGSFSETSPALPYARQLWFKPSTLQLFSFDVISDKATPPTGVVGGFWYNRSINELRQWDATSSTWVLSVQPISSRWMQVYTSNIRNSLILATERQLYLSVHPSVTQKVNLDNFYLDPLSQIELARFAAAYGYDTQAPIYDAADAFTWNYKTSLGFARWFDVYEDYFSQPGMLTTTRPNLEPWRLIGYPTKAAASIGLGFDWDTTYASPTPNRMWTTQMWTDIIAVRPGIKVCVDINTDELLPPYVSSVLPTSSYALLTTIPAGSADPFVYGDNSPVENVWRKSLDFKYGMSRVYFKRNPLEFVKTLWGDTYMSTAPGEIQLDRNLMEPLSPSKFLLHGEKLHVLTARNPESNFIGGSMVATGTVKVSFSVTHTEDNATFFYAYVNDVLQGIVQEGVPFNLTQGFISINNVTIDDLGIPFDLGDTIIISYVATPDPVVVPPPPVDPEDCGCVVTGTNDTLPFPTVTINSTWTFKPSSVKKFIGFGQLFTNLLRFSFVDSEFSEVTNAYRGWTLRLGHRLGGLIRGDSLEIDTALGTLPETAYELIIKKSERLHGKWISALRVQLVQAGTRVMTPEGNYIPYGDGSDWQFRIETYNPINPVIEFFTLNTAGDFTTFYALQKQSTDLPWKRYTEHTALTIATTPFLITGVQNIINFIYGYVDYLSTIGFEVNLTQEPIIDQETGRNLDWQLEVEKLVDRIYRDLGPGEGHVLNPFMNALWLNTPVGLMSRYSSGNFIDVTAAQAAFDVEGNIIPVNQLYVIRRDESSVTYADTPIFSAHLFTDEFEHIILFNQKLSEEIGSSTIFDPFLGMRIDSTTLAFTRQAEINRKPVFNGFILSGHDVVRNVMSSVDSMAGYYDASKTFNEETTARHALSLLGFTKKSYFSDIGISDSTQFNFWRGLIQAKGTNMSIDAFVNFKKFEDASVDEYWAYKLAEYGDARPRNQPEVKIEQDDCQQSFTQLQFFDSNLTTHDELPLFIQIGSQDDSRWFSIDDLGSNLSFSAEPLVVELVASTAGYYQLDIFHNGDSGQPVVTKNGVVTSDAYMVNAKLLKILVPGTYTISGFTWANPVTQSPIKLFDYKDNTLVKQIALWHPAIGIHAYEPLDVINTISSMDPALYNYSTQTTNNASIASLKPWGKKEVGRVWWDTSTLGYIPYYDATIFPNRNERNSRWGSLAEWATIDLYQWVESSVPPSEYDALAIEQEGQTDIPVELRASGKAAPKIFYKRDRSIFMRPIAWSKAGVGSSAAHPSFGPAFSVKVITAGGALFADSSRTEALNLTTGRHFGGWSTKPVGEATITGDIVFDLGSSLSLAIPDVTGISVGAIENGRLGQRIGVINLTTRSETDGTVYLRMSDDFSFYQEIQVFDWLGTTSDVRDFNFTDFGLVVSAAGSLIAATFAADIVAGWNDVYVREGVRYETIISLPDTVFVNDESDPDFLTHEFGWKTWDVPTQAELDADLLSPRNTWLPYLGDTIEVAATAAVVAEMGVAPLLLKNGISISRYSSVWSDWTPLTTKKVEKIAGISTTVSFDRSTFLESDEELDVNRLSIYTNGIQLNPQSYVISGEVGEEVVEIVNILPEGTVALLIYRLLQPTAAELAFDPTVEDDPSVQTQFKADYQYTKIDVRNDAGVISSAKYYFWVQDNTVVQPGKTMSIIQAKSILTNGPSQFAALARYNSSVGAFDSCVVAGLNSLVTNNDTYKLRFSRNETLQDDPEQLSLKNVHTEWALIRKSQSSKIPASLWEQLTNALAGTDVGGNALPSQNRIDYDLRNGTRTRYGFNPGQIFAETDLVRASVTNTILNTSLTINLGSTTIPDYITALDFNKSDEWFETSTAARQTMNLIWSTARPRQINEIFFETLEDALANNYEFSDLFKTSLISVYSTTKIQEQVEGEITDGEF